MKTSKKQRITNVQNKLNNYYSPMPTNADDYCGWYSLFGDWDTNKKLLSLTQKKLTAKINDFKEKINQVTIHHPSCFFILLELIDGFSQKKYKNSANAFIFQLQQDYEVCAEESPDSTLSENGLLPYQINFIEEKLKNEENLRAILNAYIEQRGNFSLLTKNELHIIALIYHIKIKFFYEKQEEEIIGDESAKKVIRIKYSTKIKSGHYEREDFKHKVEALLNQHNESIIQTDINNARIIPSANKSKSRNHRIKKAKNKKNNVESINSGISSLNLAEHPEHAIEIEETQYAIASVSHLTDYYNHYALNFIISNYVANHLQIRFMEIGESVLYLQENLGAFKNNNQQTKAIIPVRPMGSNGQQIQHFTGLYIERHEEQFSVFYIDPVGAGAINDIHQDIKNSIFQILKVHCNQFISTINKIQHSEVVKIKKEKLTVISNNHCGPYIAVILSGLALGTMRVENCSLQKLTKQEWQSIPDLDKDTSNREGIRLREKHLQLFEETRKEQTSAIQTNSAFFPRCEYYSRFKGTTYFDMDDSKYWRTYFRSTTRGGDCDRYAKEFKDSLKTFGNATVNLKHNKEHAKSGTFVSPFFHTKYKEIVAPLPPTSSKKECSNLLYDNVLIYKQKLCGMLKTKIDNAHFDKVVAVYDNEYPCIMISIRGISSKDGKENIDSWYKMIMSYYVAIVNYYSKVKGIAIELVLRSSFGHNIPSVDSTEESFRINIGIIPKIYLEILLEGLTCLNVTIIPALEKSIISPKRLGDFNARINSYNTRESTTLPHWKKNLFDTLNLQAVRGKNKKSVNVIHEIVARGRNYLDLLIDLIMQELKSNKINYARPLIKMLTMLDYSNKSITLDMKYSYSYNNQKKKLIFPKKVNAIDDNEFWTLLANISQSLCNTGRLADQIKYRQLEGIYSALEEANLTFIRSSGDQETDDGVGSDSDCEAELDQVKQATRIYARKIITATGMRAINIAAFLAFQDIISTEETEYGLDTEDMYYETANAVKNISNVMATLFHIPLNNRSKKVKKVLFFDLNKCCVQQDSHKPNLKVHLQGTSKDFLVILDYTSATTDKTREAINMCLQKVKTVLLVSSGLKNEQMGADMNPYGTLRIVSTDYDKMLSLYYLAKEALLQPGGKDYLPKVAHQLRKSYKDSGFVVTSKDIFKQYYKAGREKRRETHKNIFYWDFVRNAEEISLLLDHGFTKEQILDLHADSKAIFLRFVAIIPELIEEEIIQDETLLDLYKDEDTSELLDFSEWLLDTGGDNSLLDLSLKDIAILISFYTNYEEELDNLVNHHEVSLMDASGWTSDEIDTLGQEEIITITEEEDGLSIGDIKDCYARDKNATERVINYWGKKQSDSTFKDLWEAIVYKEINDDSDAEILSTDTLEEYENQQIEDSCPPEMFPKGSHGSDSDSDSDDSDYGNGY